MKTDRFEKGSQLNNFFHSINFKLCVEFLEIKKKIFYTQNAKNLALIEDFFPDFYVFGVLKNQFLKRIFLGFRNHIS